MNKTITTAVITALLAAGSVADAQPIVVWRPPMNCATNDGLKWSGTAWVCGSALTGSGTANRVTKWITGTSIGDTAFPIDDAAGTLMLGDAAGDVVDINGDLTKFGATGGDGSSYLSSQTLNFGYAQNVTYDGWINFNGYNNGATQFRNLIVGDGKGAAIAYAEGSTKRFGAAAGALSGTFQGGTLLYAQTASADVAITAHTTGEDRDVFIGVDDNQNYARIGTTTAQSLVFRTSNADRVTIDSSGNITTVGNTTLGDTPASDVHTINGVTTIKGGTTTTAAVPTGTVLAIEQADASNLSVALRGTVQKQIAFGNATSGEDGFVRYDPSRRMYIGVAGSTRIFIGSSGQIQMGDTSGSSISDNLDVLTIGNSGTAQTADTALINLSHTGSFNATAASRIATGALISMTDTRSAGANNVTNRALSVTSSGAQVNLAIETGDGDNRFNVTSGLSRFDGHVEAAGTDPTLSSCGTSPSIIGSDTAGVVTLGTANPTACTVTFATAYTTNAPACVVTHQINIAVPLYFSAISTSGFTVTTSTGANLNAGKFDYICVGVP